MMPGETRAEEREGAVRMNDADEENREVLRGLLARAFMPRRKPDIVQWAEENITEIPYSPLRGRFRISSSPFLAPVLRAIAAPEIRRVLLSACVQSGKTLAPEIALCYFIANSPGPALWLDVVDDSAKDQGEGRLMPLFENCPAVKAVLPEDKERRKKRSIFFNNGMSLWIAGANNKGNLQRRSIRYVFGDETWLWKADRMKEAEARTSAFGVRSKCVFMSQGSFEGDDMARAIAESDQREWMVPCPKCGSYQKLQWERVRWAPEAKMESGRWDLNKATASAHYVCEKCGAEWENTDKIRNGFNMSGKFVAQNTDGRSDTACFHWNAIATMDWGVLVSEYLAAKAFSRRGDKSALQVFYQKRLAETWGVYTGDEQIQPLFEEGDGYRIGDEWAEESVFDYQRRIWISAKEFSETYSSMSAPEFRMRFMTVDVQLGSYYWVVRAWNQSGSSRLVNRGIAMGPNDLEKVRNENCVKPHLLFIDARFRTQLVKTFCAKYGWCALMGVGRYKEFAHRVAANETVMRPFSPPQTFVASSGKVGKCFMFSSDAMKDVLAELRGGKTEMRWEIPRDIDKVYLRQMEAEYYDVTMRAWVCPEKKDNHYFDCESMQVCAAMIGGILGERKRVEGEKNLKGTK